VPPAPPTRVVVEMRKAMGLAEAIAGVKAGAYARPLFGST